MFEKSAWRAKIPTEVPMGRVGAGGSQGIWLLLCVQEIRRMWCLAGVPTFGKARSGALCWRTSLRGGSGTGRELMAFPTSWNARKGEDGDGVSGRKEARLVGQLISRQVSHVLDVPHSSGGQRKRLIITAVVLRGKRVYGVKDVHVTRWEERDRAEEDYIGVGKRTA